MIIIVYVLLRKSNSLWCVFVAALICGFVYISDVLIVQFSQTPIVVCVSGFLLSYYATFFEGRKKLRIIQLVFSILFIVLGSLFRFTPFLVGLTMGLAFIICILFSAFFENRISSNFIGKLFGAIKKCSLLFMVFAISFSISFCADLLSNYINSSSTSYSDFVKYNNARARVDDYETVSYQGNESFYNSIGINSQLELSMFGYDKELYNAETLNKIADYSERIVQNGDSNPVFAIKNIINKSIKRITRFAKDIYGPLLLVKDNLHLPISNKIFLLLVAALIFGVLVVVFILIQKWKTKIGKEKMPKRYKFINALIILIWFLFFLMEKTINNNNFLFIPLFFVIFFAIVFDKTKNYVAYILFTIVPMAVYLYQCNFRMSYRVSFTFLFPAILYMICLADFTKMKENRKTAGKSVVRIAVYSFLLISILFPSMWCFHSIYSQCSLYYDMKLRDYIVNNQDKVFIVSTPTNACVDEGYYNALFVPNIPKNEVMRGWSNSSDFFINDLKEKNINNILLDSINSNKRIVIEENGENDLNEQKKNYEDFYNIHYFNGKNTVKLELEEQFDYNVRCDNLLRSIKKVGVYKVVK